MKEILLSQNMVAIVDDEDFERLNIFKWTFSRQREKTGCAVRNIGRKDNGTVVLYRMHWEIMGKPKKGFVVDHINGNELDNRKCNLRICSYRNNARNKVKQKNNTSGYKGVSLDKRRNKWSVRIKTNNKYKFCGYFKNIIDAVKTYNDVAKKYHGKFANLNII